MRRLITHHPAIAFIALSYGWSWAFWIPAVLVYQAPAQPAITPPLLLLALVGSYGPTVAAFVLTGAADGRAGALALARRYLQGPGAGWVAAAFLIPAGVALAALGLERAAAGAGGGPYWERLGLTALVGRLLFALPFGPLAEEAGWRGYLLPLLQRRRSALASSLVVGVVWTLWHGPMFWVPGAALPPDAPVGVGAVGAYLLGVCATSIVATFLYNSSAGSLLIAVLYHLGTNYWHQVLAPLLLADPGDWRRQRALSLAVSWTLALGIILFFGPARLSRKEPVT